MEVGLLRFDLHCCGGGYPVSVEFNQTEALAIFSTDQYWLSRDVLSVYYSIIPVFQNESLLHRPGTPCQQGEWLSQNKK